MTSSTTMTTTATYTRSTTATNTRSTMLLHVFLVLFLYTNFHYSNNDAKHKIFVIHGLSFSSYTTTCTCTSSCYNHNKYANTNFYQSIDSKLHIRTNHNPSEVRERKRMRRLEYEQRVQEDAEAALIDGTLVVELDDENRPLSIIYKSDDKSLDSSSSSSLLQLDLEEKDDGGEKEMIQKDQASSTSSNFQNLLADPSSSRIYPPMKQRGNKFMRGSTKPADVRARMRKARSDFESTSETFFSFEAEEVLKEIERNNAVEIKSEEEQEAAQLRIELLKVKFDNEVKSRDTEVADAAMSKRLKNIKSELHYSVVPYVKEEQIEGQSKDILPVPAELPKKEKRRKAAAKKASKETENTKIEESRPSRKVTKVESKAKVPEPKMKVGPFNDESRVSEQSTEAKALVSDVIAATTKALDQEEHDILAQQDGIDTATLNIDKKDEKASVYKVTPSTVKVNQDEATAKVQGEAKGETAVIATTQEEQIIGADVDQQDALISADTGANAEDLRRVVELRRHIMDKRFNDEEQMREDKSIIEAVAAEKQAIAEELEALEEEDAEKRAFAKKFELVRLAVVKKAMEAERDSVNFRRGMMSVRFENEARLRGLNAKEEAKSRKQAAKASQHEDVVRRIKKKDEQARVEFEENEKHKVSNTKAFNKSDLKPIQQKANGDAILTKSSSDVKHMFFEVIASAAKTLKKESPQTDKDSETMDGNEIEDTSLPKDSTLVFEKSEVAVDKAGLSNTVDEVKVENSSSHEEVIQAADIVDQEIKPIFEEVEELSIEIPDHILAITNDKVKSLQIEDSVFGADEETETIVADPTSIEVSNEKTSEGAVDKAGLSNTVDEIEVENSSSYEKVIPVVDLVDKEVVSLEYIFEEKEESSIESPDHILAITNDKGKSLQIEDSVFGVDEETDIIVAGPTSVEAPNDEMNDGAVDIISLSTIVDEIEIENSSSYEKVIPVVDLVEEPFDVKNISELQAELNSIPSAFNLGTNAFLDNKSLIDMKKTPVDQDFEPIDTLHSPAVASNDIRNLENVGSQVLEQEEVTENSFLDNSIVGLNAISSEIQSLKATKHNQGEVIGNLMQRLKSATTKANAAKLRAQQGFADTTSSEDTIKHNVDASMNKLKHSMDDVQSLEEMMCHLESETDVFWQHMKEQYWQIEATKEKSSKPGASFDINAVISKGPSNLNLSLNPRGKGKGSFGLSIDTSRDSAEWARALRDQCTKSNSAITDLRQRIQSLNEFANTMKNECSDQNSDCSIDKFIAESHRKIEGYGANSGSLPVPDRVSVEDGVELLISLSEDIAGIKEELYEQIEYIRRLKNGI